MQYQIKNIVPHATIEVDPLDHHSEYPAQYILDKYFLIFDMLEGVDPKEDKLDKIWEFYPFGSKDLIVPPHKIEDDVLKYPRDPDLYPVLEIKTEAKGYPESLLIYPYDWVIYKTKGIYLNIGRMD